MTNSQSTHVVWLQGTFDSRVKRVTTWCVQGDSASTQNKNREHAHSTAVTYCSKLLNTWGSTSLILIHCFSASGPKNIASNTGLQDAKINLWALNICKIIITYIIKLSDTYVPKIFSVKMIMLTVLVILTGYNDLNVNFKLTLSIISNLKFSKFKTS